MRNLSPEIVPTKYDRPDAKEPKNFGVERYEFDGIDVEKAVKNPMVMVMGDDSLAHAGKGIIVYFFDGHCHVSESMYRSYPMVFLREYVLDRAVDLADDGIITGLRQTDDTTRR